MQQFNLFDRSCFDSDVLATRSSLSLVASTSASTSRSLLHTDRRICYLVFAMIFQPQPLASTRSSLSPYTQNRVCASCSSLSLSFSPTRDYIKSLVVLLLLPLWNEQSREFISFWLVQKNYLARLLGTRKVPRALARSSNRSDTARRSSFFQSS